MEFSHIACPNKNAGFKLGVNLFVVGFAVLLASVMSFVLTHKNNPL